MRKNRPTEIYHRRINNCCRQTKL